MEKKVSLAIDKERYQQKIVLLQIKNLKSLVTQTEGQAAMEK